LLTITTTILWPRLQNLYQVGMDEFLKEDVTYISNEDIDRAFWTVKNQRNATNGADTEVF